MRITTEYYNNQEHSRWGRYPTV